MPEYGNALAALARLRPEWIAIHALFCDGSVDLIMWAIDYTSRDEEGDGRYGADAFNIWSLPQFTKFLEFYNYSVHTKKFVIDIDLPKPVDGATRSYTATLDGGKVIMSGPMYLPWYLLIAIRDT